MEAALRQGCARQCGEDRNFFAARVHCCITRSALAEINEHLDAIYRIAERDGAQSPSASAEYCSLTLALLPLRDRKTSPPQGDAR